ncbi:GGDEF domain-containing protein [Marinomonas sp. CT5]|uniref:GGDEF domain-containing protein n=1 Tax=Marinomonas sp. CT5 TaxID=2066133 RepID=UPI001BAF607E|nr:GGDEF domain-containing protein [Marinomonas sp. CT5]QUX97296.1 GGDEF domain-containing protein [Marinomonas sp. CT5]
MLNWLNVSMTRKVSSLSFILLSFLFVVILYSAYQTQKIYTEMHEVAEIDVPLSELIADIEMLQLKQHILVETIRQQGQAFFDNESLRTKSVEGFNNFSQELAVGLDKAISILHNGMQYGSVRIKQSDHQSLIQKVNTLHSHRLSFEKLFSHLIKQGRESFQSNWGALEKQDILLDTQTDHFLADIDQLTQQVAATVEKQERNFMIINALLGVSAFAIGGYLTLYTILTFRRKVGSLRGQIETLHRSISLDGGKVTTRHRGLDELDELEKDLKLLMGRFSMERENRDEVETQLIELATRDKLTGAYNRHKWDEQIKDELALAKRGHHFSLILLDVDHFKKINDSYGHDIGDNVLKLLVKILRQRLRETDVLFRIGGEEFAVLLRNTHLADATVLAEELRAKIDSFYKDNVPHFTISLGVTEYRDADDQKLIVKRADVLLYKAKGTGRNTVVSG